VWDVHGSERAAIMLGQTVDRVLAATESLSADEISVGGESTQPVITASFADRNHALRGVAAAEAVRDAAARTLHPSVVERFRAGVGVNTGMVVDTHVNGAGIDFS